MSAYYNENDPKAAAWLRELIKGGHIAPGDVDERSIEDVLPNDLRGYKQCHFFAGIGGWSYALRLAGVADDTAVWTGSCPCQPFSAAGKGKGFADERHLWPTWLWLIRQRRPAIIFGEQVANALSWLDLVQGDMEAEGYAFGAAILGAHSVGAPHIRQRLYFVAHSHNNRREVVGRSGLFDGEWSAQRDDTDRRCEDGDLADRAEPRLDADFNIECIEALHDSGQKQPERRSTIDDMGNLADTNGGDASTEREQRGGQHGLVAQNSRAGERAAQTSFWGACDSVPCTDGKWRPVEPSTFPLAHGVPHRVGLLRGYGNAIVPQVAAAFIQAYGELA